MVRRLGTSPATTTNAQFRRLLMKKTVHQVLEFCAFAPASLHPTVERAVLAKGNRGAIQSCCDGRS
jgi:hypothetical protein